MLEVLPSRTDDVQFPAMRRLILIKHAMPLVEADVPPAEWRLSERGWREARLLADVLVPMNATSLYSSDERKAIETASAVSDRLDLSVHSEPGFREHARPDTPIRDSSVWRETVLDAINRPEDLVLGAETVGDARRRFTSAVIEADRSAPPGPMIIVAHGTVISMLVAYLLDIEPAPIWERLGLPSLIAVEWPARDRIELEQNFGARS